ncbi:hypothetical protein TNCV_1595691 [Trichonephila clavipes]|nr:hypothetical protein TNCV_1595691 [Trichonephila clavipes]
MRNHGPCGSYPEAPGETRVCCSFSSKYWAFLEVYFPSTRLAAEEACPLCYPVRMDGDHLLQYTGLDEYLTYVVSRIRTSRTGRVGTRWLGIKW